VNFTRFKTHGATIKTLYLLLMLVVVV